MTYDILIAGGGPAGMTAALYAARAGKSVAMIEQIAPGGQMMNTPDIDNYPGFEKIAGYELSMKMQAHAESAGAVTIYDQILSLDKKDDLFHLTGNGGVYTAKSVIVCAGAKRRKLGVPGEEEFAGRGVSYCAVCDGNFFRGRVTAVNGGGNTALEDALYLSAICEKVYLIHRRDSFRGSPFLAEKVKNQKNIELILSSVVQSINGDAAVTSLTLQTPSGERTIDTSALFVAVGSIPDTAILPENVARDETGYILTDEQMRTNIKGLYAAGDLRSSPLKQIVTACSDGAIAATAAANDLA